MPEPTPPEPTPEGHWYPSDVEHQPPRDLVLSLQRLVQEARGRLGPGADPDVVLNDLRARGLDVSRADVTHVWDAVA
jgi:hypothetical protein